jgi:hypothetical protein
MGSPDELEPSDEFQVCFPCYLLLHPSSIVFDNDGNAVGFSDQLIFVGIADDKGERSLPLFTDRDLSERFVDAMEGKPSVACVFAKHEEELVNFLEEARGHFSSVVFDPEKPTGWTRRVWPIDYVITQLKNHRGLR